MKAVRTVFLILLLAAFLVGLGLIVRGRLQAGEPGTTGTISAVPDGRFTPARPSGRYLATDAFSTSADAAFTRAYALHFCTCGFTGSYAR